MDKNIFTQLVFFVALKSVVTFAKYDDLASYKTLEKNLPEYPSCTASITIHLHMTFTSYRKFLFWESVPKFDCLNEMTLYENQ